VGEQGSKGAGVRGSGGAEEQGCGGAEEQRSRGAEERGAEVIQGHEKNWRSTSWRSQ